MRQRGDTIVEVLFAVTVFSLIAVGGLSIMNQGAAMAQRSLEIGLVRDQMDAQADALRYIHNAYVAHFGQDGAITKTVWDQVATNVAKSGSQSFDDTADSQRCHLPSLSGTAQSKPFAIDIRKLDGNNGDPTVSFGSDAASQDVPVSAHTPTNNSGTDDLLSTTYAQIRYPSLSNANDPAVAQGIWIQAVHSAPVGSTLGYYDFHITACWLTPGQAAPVTLGTIVRLYEP